MQKLVIIFLLILTPSISYGYLGPGTGVGFIAATIGIVVAIFEAIFGLLWFPIKRFLKKRKSKNQELNK